MAVKILRGDCRDVLKTLADGSINACVTSPPYYSLRSYLPADHPDKQREIGQEINPDAYVNSLVEVFREVRRVMRDDGVLWVNIGDSYAQSGMGGNPAESQYRKQATNAGSLIKGRKVTGGLKPKDLIGIPWLLATALRDPYYTGTIKKEIDRVWIAAMMDGEGTISGFRHEREDGEGIRTGVNVCLTNSSMPILDRAAEIWPASLVPHEQNNERLGTRPVFRWKPSGAENTGNFLREIYPYLVSKKEQAMLAWNLMEFAKDGRKWGKSTSAEEVRRKRDILVALISDLNQGRSAAIPDWVIEPPTMYEPGWYLRGDHVWAKPNGMPESTTDRPTRSHEYVFLLTKSERYWYDQEAVRTAPKASTISQLAKPYLGQSTKGHAANGVQDASEVKRRIVENMRKPRAPKYVGDESAQRDDIKARYHEKIDKQRGHGRRHDGFNDRWDAMAKEEQQIEGGNLRSVWWVAPAQYKEGHFAVMPDMVAEICIRAGCPEGGTVLDPFGGAGTTPLVADRLGRNAISLELSEEFAAMAERRIAKDAGMFADIAK